MVKHPQYIVSIPSAIGRGGLRPVGLGPKPKRERGSWEQESNGAATADQVVSECIVYFVLFEQPPPGPLIDLAI